jgi:hypothetical protein
MGDSIKIYLMEIRFGGEDWIHLAQDRDRWWALVHNNESLGSIKCRESD